MSIWGLRKVECETGFSPSLLSRVFLYPLYTSAFLGKTDANIFAIYFSQTSHSHILLPGGGVADVHLLMPAHQTGTHFLPTTGTIIFLSQLSNATLKPFSCLLVAHTHATRLGFFYKTRYINPLILLLKIFRKRPLTRVIDGQTDRETDRQTEK